ncbi:uncharacterized protein EAF01_011923 [Botrytis porri]|uniref:uncharacterized protein n=1 Tax=Botrytis porri TaxID=87229 RepID=UPI0018FFDBAA|nr:uncharacterized protein EAF01_011923 [Botrytis porri]KAF7880758.1 hypothetical protein EAF01_011923 [Botrytis porri]
MPFRKVTKPRAKKVEAARIDPEVANNDGEDADADKESVHRGAYSLNASKWRTVASQNIVYFSLYSPPNSRNNDSNQLLPSSLGCSFQTRSVSGLEKENSRATKPDQEKENQFSAIATEKLVQNFEPASV